MEGYKMLLSGTLFSIISILLGLLLIVIAAIVLRKSENRELTWPWVIGIIGVVGFISNLVGFVLSRIGVVDVDEFTEQVEGFAARLEESLTPLQPTLNLWGILQGVLLLIIGGVILLKPANRKKIWPWIIVIIGLMIFISNGIRFLL